MTEKGVLYSTVYLILSPLQILGGRGTIRIKEKDQGLS